MCLQCFFCTSEEEFDNLCKLIQEQLINQNQPLFELSDEKPEDWVPSTDEANIALEAIVYNG